MSKIVAIVGRPNVGKSTLFNRILGARDAIVHDEPGVTRDRQYASTDWAGKPFTIIDTGGFVPNSEDLFELAIREQAEVAIEEADAVLFVVDAEAGVHPLDEELAVILRSANKKVHLIVNKVDSDQREALASGFYRFGFGDPITISALLGRNIGNFLDEVTKTFPTEENEPDSSQLKIAIIGKPNVGKSSLVNALLGKTRTIVTPIAGTTRDSIDSVLKYKGEEIILIDTAGLRRKSRVKESVEFYSTLRTLKAIDQCKVAVLMLDVEQGIDKQDLRIMSRIVERRRGAILAANKWDTIEKDDQTAKHYERQIRSYLRMYDYVPIIFISAADKIRVFKVIELAKTVFKEQQKRIATNKLNDILSKDIAMHPPTASSGKEVKINYITQIKTDNPVITFFVNDPRLIAENYKRFLENKIREHFGFEGVTLSLQFRRKN
ncbi:MAG: ribosome biogenesis GTPase Der [Bacteroidota bacterium]